ncbi:hypothetical protein BC835DRAFT_1306655 [Cytidiella melzeri]|nr:hypothetical protein BC835DRAFT_1306655 [Cytidiella melzeri]
MRAAAMTTLILFYRRKKLKDPTYTFKRTFKFKKWLVNAALWYRVSMEKEEKGKTHPYTVCMTASQRNLNTSKSPRQQVQTSTIYCLESKVQRKKPNGCEKEGGRDGPARVLSFVRFDMRQILNIEIEIKQSSYSPLFVLLFYGKGCHPSNFKFEELVGGERAHPSKSACRAYSKIQPPFPSTRSEYEY